MAAWYHSDRKVKELLINTLALVVVLISWYYVIAAGKVLSERYLKTIDLSKYQDQQQRPNSGFWVEQN